MTLKTFELSGLFFLFFYASLEGIAQPPLKFFYGESVPVYKSKSDSIRLEEIQQLIRVHLKRNPVNENKIDSLMDLRTRISDEVIVSYRRIFKPSSDFFPDDSLKYITDYDKITRVSVSGKNQIPESVYRCKNLEEIELVNTSVRILPPELNTMPKLRSVVIHNNKIKRALRLSKNENITALTIRTDNRKTIPSSFRKLTGLTKLDLAENGITKFPNGGRHNKNLQELNLQRNNITLRNRIKRHPYLERLALQKNIIQHVPASIKNCSNLKKLNFNSNRISSVSNSIKALSKLEQLSFYDNHLKAIPEGVYKLNSLREIDLFHNQIEKLEPAISNWQSMVTLYLAYNKILELPENISELKLLEGLHVWDNRISKLPARIGDIRTLKFLRVNNNYLKYLPPSVLNLDNLEEIDISDNYITSLPEEFFNYKNLKILAIVNNPWDEKTRSLLHSKVNALREKEIFVHITEE
jgi:Leucine-rich repeat (LRR) protein